MVFQDCCTDAEAKAAGASLPLTEQEQDAQILQDIPYMVLRVGKSLFCSGNHNHTICVAASQQFRAATSSGDVENIKQKQASIENYINTSYTCNGVTIPYH